MRKLSAKSKYKEKPQASCLCFTKISMSEETKKGWGTISDERTLKELWQLNTGVIGSLLDEQLGKHLHGGVKISRLLG